MATLTIVYWRDIPAQVIVKRGRVSAKRQLAERFEKAIDRAAMRAGKKDTDSYLAEWRRGDPVDCSDDLEAEASAHAARLETEFTDERLSSLVAAGGAEAK
ncbi:MAG: virulence factor [Alphaproteobacteria bacterium]|nr:virulence factor [Alphaproteobacteria bacterium]